MRNALVILGLAVVLAGCEDSPGYVELNAPVGNRVVYVADANGDNASASGNEVYAADTGLNNPAATRVDGGISGMTLAVEPGAIGTTVGPLLFRAIDDPTDGCPARLRLVPREGGMVESLGSETDCVHGYAINTIGSRTALMATPSGGAVGTQLYAMDTTDTSFAAQISAGVVGTVTAFGISPDGNFAAYVDATGVHSVDLTGGIFADVETSLSADQPTRLFLNNGFVFYKRDGFESYIRYAHGDSFSSAVLTPALGAGDTIDPSAAGTALSPDASQFLYVATIGGQVQLWRVPVATAGGQVRADSAGSLLLQAGASFAWSKDSSTYAWTGDVGAGTQLFGATVAAPGTIVTLTATTEEPVGAIHWPDSASIAYASSDADQAVPIGYSALRTVNFTDPLNSIVLGPDETGGVFIGGITSCGDGDLVYESMTVDGTGTHTALFVATPTLPLTVKQFTPTITQAADELFEFRCVD